MAIRTNIAWMLGGRIVYAAALWLVVIVLANFGSSELLGQYSYALALTAPLIMFSRMNLRVYMVTDVHGQFAHGDYLSTRAVANALVFLAVAGLLWARGMPMTLALVVIVVASYKIVESTSDFYYGLFQTHERMRAFSISLALHGLVCLAGFAVGLFVWGSVLYGALLTAAGWLLLLYAFDRPLALRGEPRPPDLSLARVVAVTRACLLLGVIMGLISLRINVPVYFVEAHYGLDRLGLYSAAAYFLVIGNLVVTSVLEVVVPRIARARVSEAPAQVGSLLSKVLLLLLALGGVGIAAAYWFGDLVLSLVYGPEYAQTGGLLVLFAVAVTVGFVAQALGSLLTVVRLFSYQVYANLASIAVIALVCAYALEAYGLTGAGLAVIAGNVALLCVNGLSVLRFRRAIFEGVQQ